MTAPSARGRRRRWSGALRVALGVAGRGRRPRRLPRDAELRVDICEVALDRPRAEEELGGDLLVAQPLATSSSTCCSRGLRSHAAPVSIAGRDSRKPEARRGRPATPARRTTMWLRPSGTKGRAGNECGHPPSLGEGHDRIVAHGCPPQPDERDQQLGLLDCVRTAMEPAADIPAVEDQVADPLRVADGVGDGDGRPLRRRRAARIRQHRHRSKEGGLGGELGHEKRWRGTGSHACMVRRGRPSSFRATTHGRPVAGCT
jgi:hypothetical protein